MEAPKASFQLGALLPFRQSSLHRGAHLAEVPESSLGPQVDIAHFFSRNLHRFTRGKRVVLFEGSQLFGHDGVRCERFLSEDYVFQRDARQRAIGAVRARFAQLACVEALQETARDEHRRAAIPLDPRCDDVERGVIAERSANFKQMSWGDANLVAAEQHDGIGVGVVLECAHCVIEYAFGHVVQGEPAGVDGGLVGCIGVKGDEFDLIARLAGRVLVPSGGYVHRDRFLKRAALFGRSSRKHIYARELRPERAHRGDRRYGRALIALQGAGRLLLAVFGILAYHRLFVLILERDLQRCCPEIGRKHEGDGFPACAREFCSLGDGALHGPLLGLMLITA